MKRWLSAVPSQNPLHKLRRTQVITYLGLGLNVIAIIAYVFVMILGR